MTISKTFKGVAVSASLVSLAFSASAGETYFLQKDKTSPTSLAVPGDWATGSPKVPATAFNATDDYANINRTIYLRPPAADDPYFHGHSFVIGWVNGNTGYASLYLANNAFIGFDNDGMVFKRGVLDIGSTGGKNGSIKGTVSLAEVDTQDPFYFRCGIDGYSLTFDCAFKGVAGRSLQLGACLAAKYGPATAGASKPNINYALAGDCSEFLGALVMTGCVTRATVAANGTIADFASRLVLGCAEFGGTVVLSPETVLAVEDATKCVSLAGLELRSNSLLSLACAMTKDASGIVTSMRNASLSVSGACTVTGPVRVVMPGVEPPPDGVAHRLAVISAPTGTGLDAADFELSDCAAACVPHRFVVDEANGCETLYLEFEPHVILKVSDNATVNSRDVYQPSSLTNAANWTGSLAAIDPTVNYVVRVLPGTTAGLSVRTPGGGYQSAYDFQFEGKRLVIGPGCTFVSHCGTFRSGVHPLAFVGNTTLQFVNRQSTEFVGGVSTEGGTLSVATYVGSTMSVDALSGDGTVKTGAYNGSDSVAGHYYFRDTTGFTGKINAQQTRPVDLDPAYSRFQSLYVCNDALGAVLPTFEPKALRLANYSVLRVDPSAPTQTLAAADNRGVFVDGFGRLGPTEEADRLRVDWPVTLNGTLVKIGAGTAVLGGRMLFGAEGMGSPDAGAVADVVVEEGCLAVASAEAVDGARLVVSNGAKVAVAYAAANDPFAATGLRNLSETPFALGEGLDGKLPLEVDVADWGGRVPEEFTVALLTVRSDSATVSAVRAMLKGELRVRGIRGYRAKVNAEPVVSGETATFFATVSHRGFAITLR